jgi:hypothetical protein
MLNSIFTMDFEAMCLNRTIDRCDEIMKQLKPHEERWKQAIHKCYLATKAVYFWNCFGI